jgi:prefoldin subunit 5
MSDINAQLQDILAQLQSLTERVALIEALADVSTGHRALW